VGMRRPTAITPQRAAIAANHTRFCQFVSFAQSTASRDGDRLGLMAHLAHGLPLTAGTSHTMGRDSDKRVMSFSPGITMKKQDHITDAMEESEPPGNEKGPRRGPSVNICAHSEAQKGP
jgi:hypothetical protein